MVPKGGCHNKTQRLVTLGLRPGRYQKILDETVKLKGPGEKFSRILKDLKKAGES